MKKIFFAAIQAFFLLFPIIAQGVLIDLSEEQVREAKQFSADHKKDTGIVLNNMYAVGKNKLFTERVIIRTKWHKTAIIAALKVQNNEPFTEKECADILNDTFLQLDIILFGHSIDFANDYQVTLIQNNKTLKPEKVHADHFQLARHRKNIFSGFPAYRATICSYFDYTQIDPLGSIKLIIQKNGAKKEFVIDLALFK